MPVITVSLPKTSAENKAAIIERLTASAAEITRMPIQTFFTFIQEYEDDNIGCGGLTRKEAMKAFR